MVLQPVHYGLKVSVVTAPKMQPGFAVDDEIAGGAGIGDYCRNSQGRCLEYDQRFSFVPQ